MVFGFSVNWTPILPGDPNVTTGIYEFNLIGNELKIIISEEFLMLTNEASYSVCIPAISARFPEEAQDTQLHHLPGRLPKNFGPCWWAAWGQGAVQKFHGVTGDA